MSLRQCANDVSVVGYLKENNLKKGFDKNGREYINGSLKVLVSDNCEVNVRYFTYRYKKDSSAETSSFTQLTKLLKENTTSMSSLLEIDKSCSLESQKMRCTIVSLYGSLSEEIYTSKSGEVINQVRIAGRGGRICSREAFSPRATFKLEGYVNAKVEEYADENATGRAKLSIIHPDFKGTGHVIDLIAPAGNIADFILGHYEKGDTVCVTGNIVSARFEKVREPAKSGFAGAIKGSNEVSFVTEYVIDNGSDDGSILHQGDEGCLDSGDITQAMVERENLMNKASESSKETTSAPATNSFGFNAGSSSEFGGFGSFGETASSELPF